jgi:hypothetical protein
LERFFFPWHYSHSGPRPTSMNFSVHFGFSRSYTIGSTPRADDQLVARPLPVHTHKLNNWIDWIHIIRNYRQLQQFVSSCTLLFTVASSTSIWSPLGAAWQLLSFQAQQPVLAGGRIQLDYVTNRGRVTLRLAVGLQSFHLDSELLEVTTTACYFFFLATEPLRSQNSCNIPSDEKMSLSLTNMRGLSPSVRIAHVPCC